MLRALLCAIIVLLLGAAPAMAYACKDMTQLQLSGIKSHWPDAKIFVYKNQESKAIENGLRSAGNQISDVKREFIVITRPVWDKVRIVGFIDGCYEAFIDVTRRQLDDWLAGKGAQK